MFMTMRDHTQLKENALLRKYILLHIEVIKPLKALRFLRQAQECATKLADAASCFSLTKG